MRFTYEKSFSLDILNCSKSFQLTELQGEMYGIIKHISIMLKWIQVTHFIKYCAGGKIEKNEMGGACGAYGGGESCAQGSGGETGGKETNGETQTQMGG